MRGLIRQNPMFFLLFALSGLALRLVFVYLYPHYAGDSLLYVDIAQNWLHHGTYALTENGVPVPTLIRLPGYPGFLAVTFAFIGGGVEHIRVALLLQAFVDLCCCIVIAALALELFNERAAKWAFGLSALCPFTANYVALPLTETLATFFAALALLLTTKAVRGSDDGRFSKRLWLGAALALACGVVLRPDGGILLAVVLFYLAMRWLRSASQRRETFIAMLIVGCVAVAPLIPWTVRNWEAFHVFEPLAPRYANAPDEYVPLGFNRWVKTWLTEYVSVEDIFWNVSTETPGETVDVNLLPQRAFDTPEERARTVAAFGEFNQTLLLTPEIDVKFAELARERIARHPIRYYIMLPAARIADMWFRPRTEMLPVDQHWWNFDDPRESWFALGYGTLNLLLVMTGLAGFIRFRQVRIYGVLLGFVVLRSLFLSTMENPEPRYTLEMFPVVLVMAAAFFDRIKRADDRSS